MNENTWLIEHFEANRTHLRLLAFRILGSISEAEDAVQETWLRLNCSDTTAVENLTGWLTTVTSRICLDILRAKKIRREESLEAEKITQNYDHGNNPEQDALLAESIGLALLVILNTLDPAERIAFVLHDMFAVPFDEIARITDRTPAAARQLASRARRRVRGKSALQSSDQLRRKKIVEAFYAASQNGDFEALLNILDPNVTLRADRESSPSKVAFEIHGATKVAQRALAGRISMAEVAFINGQSGIIVAPGGKLHRVLLLKSRHDRIIEIEVVSNEERLRKFQITALLK